MSGVGAMAGRARTLVGAGDAMRRVGTEPHATASTIAELIGRRPATVTSWVTDGRATTVTAPGGGMLLPLADPFVARQLQRSGLDGLADAARWTTPHHVASELGTTAMAAARLIQDTGIESRFVTRFGTPLHERSELAAAGIMTASTASAPRRAIIASVPSIAPVVAHRRSLAIAGGAAAALGVLVVDDVAAPHVPGPPRILVDGAAAAALIGGTRLLAPRVGGAAAALAAGATIGAAAGVSLGSYSALT